MLGGDSVGEDDWLACAAVWRVGEQPHRSHLTGCLRNQLNSKFGGQPKVMRLYNPRGCGRFRVPFAEGNVKNRQRQGIEIRRPPEMEPEDAAVPRRVGQ